MHRVVVTTLQNEVLSVVNVSGEELVSLVAGYAVLDGVNIYIDNVLLSQERRALLLQALGVSPTVMPQPMPTPVAPPLVVDRAPPMTTLTVDDAGSLSTLLRQAIDEIHRGFEAVREAETRSYRELHDFWRAAAEAQIGMQRDIADEAVRQRKLTAQSLGDIDLMHRAVKAAELNEAFAQMKASYGREPRATAPTALARRPGPGFGDFLRATWKFFSNK